MEGSSEAGEREGESSSDATDGDAYDGDIWDYAPSEQRDGFTARNPAVVA